MAIAWQRNDKGAKLTSSARKILEKGGNMEIGTWIFKAILIIITSYMVGCLTTAYYLVRFRTGQDIRELGSGNVGGRNAARVLGKWGFIITFIFDTARGALALLIANYIGLGLIGLVLSRHASWAICTRYRLILRAVKALLSAVASFLCSIIRFLCSFACFF